MKTLRNIIAATSIVALAACAREMVQQSENFSQGQEYEFTAGFADDTKTVIQTGGEVWWSPKEEITIFYGSQTKGKFTSINTSAAKTTDFKGAFDSFEGSIEFGTTSSQFWAVYPYDKSTTCDGNNVTISIPSTQTAVAGTFNNKLFPSIAKTSNLSLTFWFFVKFRAKK